MTESPDPVTLASIACLPCRLSKRRCDKQLPCCGLCIKKRATCSYPVRLNDSDTRLRDKPSPFTQESVGTLFTGLSSGALESELLLAEGNLSRHKVTNNSSSSKKAHASYVNTNAVYFIAPQIFQRAQLKLTSRDLPIPTEVQSLTGNLSDIRAIASQYFFVFHRWLPIISKRNFLNHLLSPLAQRQTELALLALCMKLCCTPPLDEHGDRGERSPLYLATKRFYHDVETTGLLSIHVIQANVLLATYEMSHGIYPAAYLTGGSCARSGLALGINRFDLIAVGNDDDLLNFHKIEERRRVWWAILMFDRFLSMNDPTRPLSTQDPVFDTYLPVDDDAWDNCTAKPEDAVTISTGFTLKMGSFARLAQATFLLSQALRTVGSGDGGREKVIATETAQLRRTLLALVHAADREATVRKLEFCSQSALSLSTIVFLQIHCLQKQNHDVSHEPKLPWFSLLNEETLTTLERLSSAADSCNTAYPNDPGITEHVPLCVIHVMYQVSCLLLTLAEEGYDNDIHTKLKPFKSLLLLMNSRWRLAGVYLDILESREVMIPSDTGYKNCILPSI